jgi:hypothetical protein
MGTACGSRMNPSDQVAAVRAANRLPVAAPFLAVARPVDLDALYARLAGGKVLSAMPVRFLKLPTALAFVDSEHVWMSAQLHGELAVRRAMEDAERLLQEASQTRTVAPAGEEGSPVSPGDPTVADWLASKPLPPVWVHSRFVGPRASDVELAMSLGTFFGGVQVVSVTDPVEVIAEILGVDTEGVEAIVSHLHRRGVERIYRLLGEELETVVLESGDAETQIIDLIQDQALGAGAIAAAIESLNREGNQPNRVIERLGQTTKSGLLRIDVEHRGWSTMMRALGEVMALQAVLTNSALLGDGLAIVRAGREGALEPQYLLELSTALFGSSRIDLSQSSKVLAIKIAARYAEKGRWLAGITGARPPVDHRHLKGLGRAAITVSIDPVRWQPLFAQHISPPSYSLAIFLQRALHCGIACMPSLWSALPVYGVNLNLSLGSIFPELDPLEKAMGTVRSASMVIDGDIGARRFASLLQFQVEAGVAEKVWTPLVDGLKAQWNGAGAARSLLIGTAPRAVSGLAVARTHLGQPSKQVLQLTVGGARGQTAKQSTELSLSFEADAMVIDALIPSEPTK